VIAALAEKSNLKNSGGNGYGLRLRKRQFFGLASTATTTARKTDQERATTATEKTTLNQVHSGPKTGSTSMHRSLEIAAKPSKTPAF